MLTDTNFDENTVFESLVNKFKIMYPDIDPFQLDSDLLQNMLANILEDDNLKYNKSIITNNQQVNKINDIIKENILMADELIPEMSVPSNLIYLEGKISNTPINIMIDTGASSCFTYKSIIEKCGLEYLIDSSSRIMVQGAHGIKATLGCIWFLEIELDISNGKKEYVSIPITIDIIDDSEINQSHKNNLSNEELINNKSNNLETNKNKLELILGINFLKSYRANIDISTMTLTLNKTIKIKFK
jgi:hypothetical protein